MGCGHSGVKEPAKKFHDQYQLGEKIGAGSMGQVRICYLGGTIPEATEAGAEVDEDVNREKFAVKILDLRARDSHGYKSSSSTINANAKRSSEREVGVWRHLGQHGHTVKLHDTYFERGLQYFVMELCHSSVLDQLDSDPFISEGQVMRVFLEMVYGIGHCHARGIVHRDVKPDNFIYGGEGRSVKLCDFGLAEFVSRLPRPNLNTHGTAPYMSPEMLNLEGYDVKTDIWSLGVTAYLLLYGDFPYAPTSRAAFDMKEAVRRGTPAPQFKPEEDFTWLQPSKRSEDFVRALIMRNPRDRPTIQECLQLPLMRSARMLAEVEGQEPDSPATRLKMKAHLQAQKESAAQEAEPSAQMPLFTKEGSRHWDPSAELGNAPKPQIEHEHKMHMLFDRAKKQAKQFKVTIDPTFQKSIDELLTSLQQTHQGKKLFSRSFSLNNLPDAKKEEKGRPTLDRRLSKSSTCGALDKLMDEIGGDQPYCNPFENTSYGTNGQVSTDCTSNPDPASDDGDQDDVSEISASKPTAISHLPRSSSKRLDFQDHFTPA